MSWLAPAYPMFSTSVGPVLRELDGTFPDLPPVMLVGAVARDGLHRAGGHTTPLRRTSDLDLALAVNGWEHFQALTARLRPIRGAHSSIRYDVGGHPVDLVPFGGPVERPDGVVTPARRGHTMSVFGFQDVYHGAHQVPLGGGLEFRVPTIPGYLLLKLKAWADRSAAQEYRDGEDLAVAAYWYQNDDELLDARLFGGGDEGLALLERSDFDVPEAAVRLLISDAIALLSAPRRLELAKVWASVDDELLARYLANPLLPGWPKGGDPQLSAWTLAIREQLTGEAVDR